MVEIIGRIGEIAARYDALLCDLWGCYHDGVRPFPEAVAALRAVRARGGIVILLTNAPRPVSGVERFLATIGAPDDTHDAVLSSGEVCAAALRAGAHGRAMHFVGPPERDASLIEAGGIRPVALEEADAILCTGLRDDRGETPGDYREEIAGWVARGLPMLCANPDIVVDRGATRLWCAGALALEMERAGGAVHYFGKPHAPVYEAALARLAAIAGRPVPPERVLAVGDGIATDIAGAAGAGIDAVFVTGGIAAAEIGDGPDGPNPGRLDAYLARHGADPRYAMDRLR